MLTWVRALGAAAAVGVMYFVDITEEPAASHVKTGFVYGAAFTAACLAVVGLRVLLTPGLGKREVKFRRPPSLMNLSGGKHDITMTHRAYDLEKFRLYVYPFAFAYGAAVVSHVFYGYVGPMLFVTCMMPPSLFHNELGLLYLLCFSTVKNPDLRRPWERVNQTWVQFWQELKREVRNTMGGKGGAGGRRNKKAANLRAVNRS